MRTHPLKIKGYLGNPNPLGTYTCPKCKEPFRLKVNAVKHIKHCEKGENE